MALNVAGGIALLLVLVALSPGFINSDSASGILLAQHLLESGQAWSRDWAYVSDSLGLDGRAQVAMAGVVLFGPTAEAFMFTACVGVACALAAGYLLSRLLGASRGNAVTASMLLLLGPSLIYLDLVVGLTISIQMALVLCFVAALVAYTSRRGNIAVLLAALAILAAMTLSSPKKALAYMVLPVIASGVVVILAHASGAIREQASRRRMLIAVAAIVLVCAAGALGHQALLRQLTVDASYAKLKLALTPSHLSGNAAEFAELFARFAGSQEAFVPAASVAGAVACLAVFFCAPFGGTKLREFAVSPQGLAYLYAFFGSLVVTGYILTYETIRPYYGIYYVLVPLCPLLAVAAWSASRAPRDWIRRITRIALAVGLLAGVVNVGEALDASRQQYVGMSIKQRTTHADHVAVTDWLGRADLTRGFATYWEANTITLLSGGTIRVTPIRTPAGGRMVRRMVWLAERDRVNYMPEDERWFILLPAKMSAAKLPPTCLPATAQATVGASRIYVYDRVMPGCLQRPARFGPRTRRKSG